MRIAGSTMRSRPEQATPDLAVVASCEAAIAVGGRWGTAAEISCARLLGRGRRARRRASVGRRGSRACGRSGGGRRACPRPGGSALTCRWKCAPSASAAARRSSRTVRRGSATTSAFCPRARRPWLRRARTVAASSCRDRAERARGSPASRGREHAAQECQRAGLVQELVQVAALRGLDAGGTAVGARTAGEQVLRIADQPSSSS